MTYYVLEHDGETVWFGYAQGIVRAFELAREARPDLADTDLTVTSVPGGFTVP